MAQVTVSWDVTSQNFPAGTVAGNFHVEITGGTLIAPLVMDVPTSPAVFPDVPEEADTDPPYTVTVQRQDAAGNPLGLAASSTFRVSAPPSVAVDVPNLITVVVG